MPAQSRIAGQYIIEDRAILGAQAAFHQFIKVGTLALAGACSRVVKDIPPYIISDGHPAHVRGLNSIGLQRNGVSSESRLLLKKAYRLLFRSNLNREQAVQKVREDVEMCAEVAHLLEFVETSQRGIGV